MIYLIGAEKGGCGKSTLATNFAGILSAKGIDVMLIDTDKQASSARFVERRNDNPDVSNLNCVRLMGKGLPGQVKSLNEKYGTIIIDAGGQDSIELRASMVVCHKMIIPVKPSQFDAETIPAMSDLIDKAQIMNPSLSPTIIVSMASPNPVVKEDEELIEALKDFDNLVVADTIIRERKVYRDVLKTGLTVLEAAPINRKARDEMINLFEEVTNECN
jgi:chromosome partitioning protein